MAFSVEQPVMFKHCDPVGIVFYPRYFEMINDCVELFFEGVLGYPFYEMLPNAGIPTAQLNTSFSAPSRLGDVLTFSLTCLRLGNTSLGLKLVATCGEQERLVALQTVVHVNSGGRPMGWPDRVREIIENQLEPE